MVYAITKKFPKSEMYGLMSQMRRAAVSISSNIAEGKKRKTRKDAEACLTEIQKMLISMIYKLENGTNN